MQVWEKSKVLGEVALDSSHNAGSSHGNGSPNTHVYEQSLPACYPFASPPTWDSNRASTTSPNLLVNVFLLRPRRTISFAVFITL